MLTASQDYKDRVVKQKVRRKKGKRVSVTAQELKPWFDKSRGKYFMMCGQAVCDGNFGVN